MKQEEIIENAKLIARFMGKTITPQVGTPEFKFWKGERCDYSFYEIKYDSSWDWLMPVVEKIEGLGYYTQLLSADNNSKKHVMYIVELHKEVTYKSFVDSKIEAAYQAVVYFIKWYNTQNNG